MIQPDRSAWLDQIERARFALIQTIKSGPATLQQHSIATSIDQHIKILMDVIIDEETRKP